jgi:serine protease inhibitor
MFVKNHANFSEITDEEIFVKKIIHKAVLKVNEDGSEAAASTGVQFHLGPKP